LIELNWKEIPDDWRLECRFPYEEIFKNFVKGLPGTEWSPTKRCWLVPIDLKQTVEKEAEKHET
jgi:hypothetical protein